MRDRIAELRGQIRALGPVNEEAASEYEENRERYDFLSGQLNDLKQAEDQLQQAVGELESVIRDRFRTTFKQVNTEFERYFNAFFRGGTARLELGEIGRRWTAGYRDRGAAAGQEARLAEPALRRRAVAHGRRAALCAAPGEPVADLRARRGGRGA